MALLPPCIVGRRVGHERVVKSQVTSETSGQPPSVVSWLHAVKNSKVSHTRGKEGLFRKETQFLSWREMDRVWTILEVKRGKSVPGAGRCQCLCCCSATKLCLTLCDPMDCMQPTSFLCPSLSPGVCSDSSSRNQWCYLTNSPPAAPFSFCLPSFPASGFGIRWQKYWSFSISPSNEYSVFIGVGNFIGFPGDSDGKESACTAGDLALIPESGRSPGQGNGYPLQYSCLENSMDRGAWRATVMHVAKSWTWQSG